MVQYGYPYRVVRAMKTTIEIADDLIQRAKVIQKRDAVTLRALVEDGLRLVLEQHAKPAKPYKFVPVVAGPSEIDWSMTPEKVNRLIDESRERDGTTYESVRVAETEPESPGKPMPRPRAKKRRA